VDDEKRHNFKKLPISKEEFRQEKERLMAINARVPKKILEAKARRRKRIQSKLKKTEKKADTIMSQEGITEVNKLRQVGKLYDQSKRQLKDSKRYVIGKKGGAVGGKDTRKVKHVDRRLKKDKRALKRISKTRQVKRHSRKRGRF
jgi:AdoMet-dependent rRNA methyltransferase SPB1